MMGTLALVLTGNTTPVPGLIAGELATAAGVLMFAANLFVNIKAAAPENSARTATMAVRA